VQRFHEKWQKQQAQTAKEVIRVVFSAIGAITQTKKTDHDGKDNFEGIFVKHADFPYGSPTLLEQSPPPSMLVMEGGARGFRDRRINYTGVNVPCCHPDTLLVGMTVPEHVYYTSYP